MQNTAVLHLIKNKIIIVKTRNVSELRILSIVPIVKRFQIYFVIMEYKVHILLLLNIHHRMKSITLHNLVFDKTCKYISWFHESLSIFMLLTHYTHIIVTICNRFSVLKFTIRRDFSLTNAFLVLIVPVSI